MTDTKKYSVIIPVYNAEKMLARCLESVLAQKRDDVELVVVNDGSSDGSDGIVSDFLKTNENIVYICQENAGVSRARNVGMGRASGEYIVFLDSDDYMERDYFSELDRMDEADSDLVVFAYRNHGNLTGKDTERYPYIANADLYVQPSRYENYSVVILEAMVLCKPILATIPAASEQITSGQNGLLCEADPHSIAVAIEQLMEDEEERCRYASYLAEHSLERENEMIMEHLYEMF